MPAAYRRDIDGLRTVAVAPVVLYHAGVAPFTGGFVGVDVFFVISGFLITSILKGDLEAGRYSLRVFYERRARRILPALATCIAATLLAAAFILPPGEMNALGASVLRVAAFISNVHFWREGGYFGREAEEQPLLHTWSLAVEEQFYIIWPILLALVIWRLKRRDQIAVLLALIAASFALAVWKAGDKAAFFLPQYRAWELGVGALLGMGFVPRVHSPSARGALAVAGLAMILVPMLVYTHDTTFPGVTALPPVLGTALLIHVGQGSAVGRMLSWKPMVGVGLISYSLYLWHWPILVLSRIWLNRPLTPIETALAIAAGVLAAWISWRFIEAPFRRPARPGIGNLKILAGSAATLAAVAFVGQAAAVTSDAPWRTSAAVREAEAAGQSINPSRGQCHVTGAGAEPPPQAGCTARPGAYQILLWGDSHADHFAPVVQRWAAASGMAARQASKSACRPLLTGGTPRPELGIDTADCAHFNGNVLAEAADLNSIRVVVLSGWWKAGDGALAPQLAETIGEIHKRLGAQVQVVVLGSTPAMRFWTAQCLSRARYNLRDEGRCREGVATNADAAIKADEAARRAVAAAPNARFIDLWNTICEGAKCRTVDGDVVLMRDHNHFTLEGADHVLRPRLDQITLG